MSVFSKLKLSKKAAKEHKAKAAEKGKEITTAAPYQHVPTHAAVDALSGAPSSWKAEDRPKIKDYHKRRSEMVISRTGSSLSTVSYMNSMAGPSSSSALPRNSSYSSYNPTWFDRTGDIQGMVEPPQKRYRRSRGHSYHDSGIGASVGPSPLASNIHSEAVSPVVSSGNSTTSTSSDNLEMPTNPRRRSQRPQCPQPMVYAEKDIFDGLHTSTTRKLGEAPISTTGPVTIQKPTPATAIVAQEQKQKKQRWSLRGKRNTATLVV